MIETGVNMIKSGQDKSSGSGFGGGGKDSDRWKSKSRGNAFTLIELLVVIAVSYTHLDVYKRQQIYSPKNEPV